MISAATPHSATNRTFSQVTVVSIAGHNDGASVIDAIERTMDELPRAHGLLLSLGRPRNLPSHIKFVKVKPIDYFQYSIFMIHSLHLHIDTEYALVVQEDGWALNGGNWDDAWLCYDYIGAPTHAAGVSGSLYGQFSWLGMSSPKQVMNGGFSLRSKRLLEAPSRYGICYKPFPRSVLGNEDVQLCVLLRDELESAGLRFAPTEIAMHFSVEFMHPVVHRELSMHKVFGHHASTRKLRPHSVVEVNLTSDQIRSIYGEAQFLETMRAYGYVIKCLDPSGWIADPGSFRGNSKDR